MRTTPMAWAGEKSWQGVVEVHCIGLLLVRMLWESDEWLDRQVGKEGSRAKNKPGRGASSRHSSLLHRMYGRQPGMLL
jgi:hypothetical protein